jgi:DNA-binding transcriptional regulator YiaG
MERKTPIAPKRANMRKTPTDFERQTNGDNMTGLELKAKRLEAGLSVTQAARLVYRDERTWQRYESGKTQVPGAIVELFEIKTGKAK